MRHPFALAISLITLAIPCAAATPPAPHAISASYDVFRNGMHVAVSNETFEAKDDTYHIVSEAHAVGLLALFFRQPLRMVSSGRVTASGLQPRHFEGKRGESDSRQARADFDWQSGLLTITHDGKTDSLKLPPATQDLVSGMYQFMFLEPGKLQRFEMSMTNGRKLDRYLYVVRSGVEIETPLGRMTTVHLVKQHRPDESGMELWLAPQHRYLPVKMLKLEEDGTRYEQIATKLEVKGP